MSRRYATGAYVSTTEQGYGYKHQQLRKVWAARVEAGQVACGKCGRFIAPGSEWDLAHPFDDKNAEPAPWHQRCNRSYAASVTKRRLNGLGPVPTRRSSREPADDWFLHWPPMKWSRWWGKPPPQGVIVGRDPTVHYPDGDPRNRAAGVPTVVSLDEEVEKLRAKQQDRPTNVSPAPRQQVSIPLTEFYGVQ